MIHSKTIQEQYEAAANDELKILVVGAGVAGISVAQLLRKQGKHPVLIERKNNLKHTGYMLALMPMVDPIFKELELQEEYKQRSTGFSRYGLHSLNGKLFRVDSMTKLLEHYGDYRGISRGALIDTLTVNGCEVTFNSTVSSLQNREKDVLVSIQTAHEDKEYVFDQVIIADGIHSHTREFVVDKNKVEIVDTKWGGWVVWAPEDENMDLGEELWGAGYFYGVYPVKNNLGVFIGCSIEDAKMGAKNFVKKIRSAIKTIDHRLENCLTALENEKAPFFWELSDCRCSNWVNGRTVLIGDAAAGFLPTAGIGAGMAMESAWILASLLKDANHQTVDQLLAAFEEVQKPRVEAAQKSSRILAKLMFRQSKLLAAFRIFLMHFVSIEVALKPIQKLIANQPNPEHVAMQVLQRKNT